MQSRQRNGDVEASSVGGVMELRAHDGRHSDALCWWICLRPSVCKRDDHMVHSVVPKGKSLEMRFLPPPRILVAFRVRVDEEEASFLGIGSLQLRIRKSAEVSGWVQRRRVIVAIHQKLLLAVTPREVKASAHGAERELCRSVVPDEDQSCRKTHHQRLNHDYQNEHSDEFPIAYCTRA